MQRKPTVTALALLLSATLLGGCTDDGDENTTLEPTGFATEASELLCAKLFSCCDEAERQAYLDQLSLSATDEAECAQGYANFLTAFFATPLDASAQAGRAEFNATGAQGCLSSAEALSCEAFFADTEAIVCPALIVGLVAEGGVCTQNYECAGALFCKAEAGQEEGACAPLPGEGEACVFDCAEGLYCDFVTGICEQKKQNSLGCQSGEECQSGYCTDNENGQFCDNPPVICAGG